MRGDPQSSRRRQQRSRRLPSGVASPPSLPPPRPPREAPVFTILATDREEIAYVLDKRGHHEQAELVKSGAVDDKTLDEIIRGEARDAFRGNFDEHIELLADIFGPRIQGR